MSDVTSPSSTQISHVKASRDTGVRSMSLTNRSSPHGKTRRWTNLRSTVIAAHLFKTPDVSIMQDLNELLDSVERAPFPRLPPDHTELSAAIEAHRLTEGLFMLVEQGGIEAIPKIEKLLLQDPRRYVTSVPDSRSLVNRKSIQGHTLLYQAALHGNSAVVSLLLKYGGDPHEPSPLGKREYETPLEAASRWGHLNVVESLLQSARWSQRELKSALKISRNDDVSKAISPLISKSSFKRRCFFCF